jgi:O-methyltransferase
MLNRIIKAAIRRTGYQLQPITAAPSVREQYPDVSPQEWQILDRVKPFTMLSYERLLANISAVNHIVSNQIQGAIVECGVWRGGSSMAMAMALLARGDTGRNLWFYDTFEGMTEPTPFDKLHSGLPAVELLNGAKQNEIKENSLVLAYSALEDVRKNVGSTGYTESLLHFVKGPVEQTIPARLPGPIAILRLDTDWYESTRHELQHLFPLLVPGGILIIDDYGHWLGARRAVDEYFGGRAFLHRIDYTGRLLLKDHSVPTSPAANTLPFASM